MIMSIRLFDLGNVNLVGCIAPAGLARRSGLKEARTVGIVEQSGFAKVKRNVLHLENTSNWGQF